VDTDFEQKYRAAERAYGLGDYTKAHALTLGLWDRLQLEQNNQPPEVFLGWSAVVALLLGHIQLHGLHLPAEAIDSYQRVLESEPEDTIAALAKQGLERCQAPTNSIEALESSEENNLLPDLLKDPLLTENHDSPKPALPNVATAMPWLHGDDNASEPNRDEQPVLKLESSTEPEPTVAPKGDGLAGVTTQKPETTAKDASPEEVATIELLKTQEEPAENNTVPIPKKPEAKDLLEKSWLRRQLNLKPEIKNPTDSSEPMGLINKIKGVFARSAGR
jgi:hypothetical protein